jgi:type IV pilus assembly protein PilO
VAKKKQAVNLDLYVQRLSEIDLPSGRFEAVAQQIRSRVAAGRDQPGGDGPGPAVRSLQARGEQVRISMPNCRSTVRLTGTYHDFGAFAGDIGKLSRIVTLNNISIVTNQQSKDGSLVMDATTKTFRYLDEEELAAKKKAAEAAKKGGKK